MRENQYQADLIKKIKQRLPGCEVLKNNPNYLQGVCDLLVLYNNRWAMLETKASQNSKKQPNQDYYVKRFGSMSYAAFIFPENEETILHEMERSLTT